MTTLTADQLLAALPDLHSPQRLRGLEGPVDVFRDTFGIPHVRADSMHDAFFAQGFVHAQDRLWQMDYDRRRAAGRLAAVLGVRVLTMDVFVRRIGIEATAIADYAAFDETTRWMLDAYAEGVNAFIDSTPALPVEFELLGITPEPWQPWHCGSAMKVRHVLMGNYDRKLWRAHLMNTVGVECAVAVGSAHGRSDTLIVPMGADRVWTANPEDLEPGALAVAGVVEGSNNWAVHGRRTASGSPLVAGDPHRTLEVPNVYYQNRIACPDFDAIGLSIAGVPGMFHFGHNANVAWCVTHAMADNQDLYVERFFDGHYEFRSERIPAQHRTEVVAVRGEPDITIDITVTHHGPVLFGDPASGSAITMRWTGTDAPNTTLRSVVPMFCAASVDELEDAMRWWIEPCNNLVIADTHGTIAYLHRGRVPVRPRANGWAPVPGWTGQHEWEDDVPFEALPRLRNPEGGYIVTANNRVCADDFPYYLGMDYAAPYRVRRALARVASADKATAEDMAGVHADRVSLGSDVFIAALRTVDAAGKAADARDRLLTWNRSMEPDDVAPTIYAVLREAMAEILCEREPMRRAVSWPYPEEPLPTPAQTRVRAALPRLIERDDRSVLDGGEWADVIGEALERAVAWLCETLGQDMQTWRWERLHTTQITHPVARTLREAADVLNPPRLGCGGDGETVQATGWETGLAVQHGSVARYVFDLGDWDRSGWIVPLGSSGHPGSEHYADQAERWARVELVAMTYSWDKIEAGARTRQLLDPSR